MARLLSAAAAAKEIGITARSLRRYVPQGCPHVKDAAGRLRFNVDAVRRWMKQHGRDGTPGRPVTVDEVLADAQAELDQVFRRGSAPVPGALGGGGADDGGHEQAGGEPGDDAALDFAALLEALKGRHLTDREATRVKQLYALSKAQKERVEAARRDMLLRKDAGELLAAEDVARDRAALLSTLRTGLLAVPARIAPLVVGIDEAGVRKRLEDAVRRLLQEMSRSGEGAP